MSVRRTERLSDRIWQELSVMLQREVGDPRVTWVTLTGATVSPDLSYAKVFFTVLDETQAKEAAEGLKKASGFLRTMLSKKLNVRHTPQLSFVFDDSTLKARRIDALLAEKQP